MPRAARDVFWRLLKLLDGVVPSREHSSLQEAAWCCARSHAGQTRDDGSPYVFHPLRVATTVVEEFGISDPVLVRAALLHDVLEDDLTLDAARLERSFGAETAAVVAALTKTPRGVRSRQEANREYFARLAAGPEGPRLVKLADKLDNVRDAVNCPEPEKRQRTAAEGRELAALLVPALCDRVLAERVQGLLDEALQRLEQSA